MTEKQLKLLLAVADRLNTGQGPVTEALAAVKAESLAVESVDNLVGEDD